MIASVPLVRARQAARLVHEVIEIGPCTEEARRHIKTMALHLVGAVIAGAVDDLEQAMQTPDARAGVYTVATPYHSAVLHMLGTGADPVTATNADVVPEPEWRRSTWMNEHVRPAGLDHFLGSHWRLPGGTVEGMGFMRAAGDSAFDDEDRAVLHLVHLGIGRLFHPVVARRRRLPPRARATLDALLTGASDKDIAAALGISVYTVRDYVKMIFRELGVSSRAQVLALASGRPPERF